MKTLILKILVILLSATAMAQANTYSLPGDAGSGPFSNCSANGNVVTCTSDVTLGQGDEVVLDNVNEQTQLNIASNLNIPQGVNINPDGTNQSLLIDASALNFNGQASVRANVTANDVNLNHDSTLIGNLNLVALNLNSGMVVGNIVTFGNLNNNGTIEGNAFVGGEVNNNSGSLFNGNITADGNVNASSDSSITGNINSKSSVNANGADIGGYVNAQSISGGSNIQGTTCNQNENIGPCSGSEPEVCSDRIGQGSINELHGPTGNNWFIEVKILNESIPRSVYEQWTVHVCSSGISPCKSFPLHDSRIRQDTFPWIVIPQGLIGDRDYIDFGQGAGDGMEVRLDDANGKAIDYVSVAGYSQTLSQDCDYLYDTESPASSQGSQTLLRNPDGTGDWTFSGPGGSQSPTEGDSNLDEDEDNPYPRLNINDVTVDAGVADPQAEFEISLEDIDGGPLTSDEAVTVNYRTVDGDGSLAAQAPQDYEAISDGEVTIPPNTSSVTVEVNVKQEARDDHFFYLLIESAYEGDDGPVVLRNHFGTAVISADPPTEPLAYIELGFSSQALTCQATPVSIRACTESGCDSENQYANTVSLDLTANMNAQWVGSTEITFVGQTTRDLAQTENVEVTVGATNISPAPEDAPPVRCNGGTDCNIDFVNAAILIDGDIDDSEVNSAIPTQIAGKPSNQGVKATNKLIRVVQTDPHDTAACIPALENETLEASFSYAIPEADLGLADNQITIEGESSGILENDGVTQNVQLTFDEDGTAPFHFTAQDAGQYRLDIEMDIPVTDEGGTPIGGEAEAIGSSNVFNVRPLAVFADASGNPQASGHDGPAFTAAGDDFTLSFKPIRWTADRDSNNDGTWDNACEDATLSDPDDYARVPNWNIGEPSPNLIAPSGGNDGTLTYSSGGVVFPAGVDVISADDVSYSEVGIIRVDDTVYFYGDEVQVCSPNIGRFIPDRFSVEWRDEVEPAFAPASGAYTYQGQYFDWLYEPKLVIKALNTSGDITRNYGQDFFNLTTDPDTSIDDTTAPINFRKLSAGGTSLQVRNSSALVSAITGNDNYDGQALLTIAADADWTIGKVVDHDHEDQFPQSLEVRLTVDQIVFTDQDGVTDQEGIFWPEDGEPRDPAIDISGGDLIYGRLVLGSGQAPATRNLRMPLRVERWEAESPGETEGRFRRFEDESGNAYFQHPLDQLFSFSPELTDLDYVVDDSFAWWKDGDTFTDPSNFEFSDALAELIISLDIDVPAGERPPTERVIVTGTTNIPVFLRHAWPHAEEDADEDLVGPRAIASFGTYEGRPPVLFMLPQGR